MDFYAQPEGSVYVNDGGYKGNRGVTHASRLYPFLKFTDFMKTMLSDNLFANFTQNSYS